MNHTITIYPSTPEEIEESVKLLLLEIFRKVQDEKTAVVITMRDLNKREFNDNGGLHG